MGNYTRGYETCVIQVKVRKWSRLASPQIKISRGYFYLSVKNFHPCQLSSRKIVIWEKFCSSSRFWPSSSLTIFYSWLIFILRRKLFFTTLLLSFFPQFFNKKLFITSVVVILFPNLLFLKLFFKNNLVYLQILFSEYYLMDNWEGEKLSIEK